MIRISRYFVSFCLIYSNYLKFSTCLSFFLIYVILQFCLRIKNLGNLIQRFHERLYMIYRYGHIFVIIDKLNTKNSVSTHYYSFLQKRIISLNIILRSLMILYETNLSSLITWPKNFEKMYKVPRYLKLNVYT